MLIPGVLTYKAISREAPHTGGQLALEGDLDQPSLVQLIYFFSLKPGLELILLVRAVAS